MMAIEKFDEVMFRIARGIARLIRPAVYETVTFAVTTLLSLLTLLNASGAMNIICAAIFLMLNSFFFYKSVCPDGKSRLGHMLERNGGFRIQGAVTVIFFFFIGLVFGHLAYPIVTVLMFLWFFILPWMMALRYL